MTADQYWRGDPSLVKAYRKAEEIRMDRLNQQLWWQGMYIYEALCDASPLFRAFGKKGSRALPYTKEPYDIKPKKQKDPREAEKKQMLKGKRSMEAFMATINANRARKENPNAGRNDHRQPANSNISGSGQRYQESGSAGFDAGQVS